MEKRAKIKRRKHEGRQLREYLDKRGISYTWLCRQCKSINKFRLNRIFKGSPIQYLEAIEISNALCVPLSDLQRLSEIPVQRPAA